MKFLLLLCLMFAGASFAQDQTLEERVATLEHQLADLPSYIENRCSLVLDFAGTSSAGCFDSVATDVRTNIRAFNGIFYVTNWVACKRYRLVCR